MNALFLFAGSAFAAFLRSYGFRLVPKWDRESPFLFVLLLSCACDPKNRRDYETAPFFGTVLFFCGRRPLPFGGLHLRFPSGPAGIRTTTGSLSALARPTPYQLSHRVVKNVNPSTPLVYPNRRFRKNTTPDANTYCGCGSAVTYFPTKSNKGTCSTPTPKCTSDSFFSLQTPHTTEQVNKNQGRHTATAHKQRKEARKFQCGYCFKCPR